MKNRDSLTRRGLLVGSALVGTAAGAAAAKIEQGDKTGLRRARLSAADRLDIQDVFARYAWTFDCSDEAGYLDCYTDDAIVIGVNPGQVFRGKDAIRGWFRYLTELREKADEDWLHDAYHHRFFGDPRRVIVYSYATHFNFNQAQQRRGVRSVSYFVSECVPQRGEWLIRRHSVSAWDRHGLPWKKPLPWAQFE